MVFFFISYRLKHVFQIFILFLNNIKRRAKLCETDLIRILRYVSTRDKNLTMAHGPQ